MDTSHLDYEPLFQGFHDLMPYRVQEILLVSSLYDTFVLEEDGLLAERILGRYLELNLSHPPRVTQVSTTARALARLADRHFDCVVAVDRYVNPGTFAFGRELKKRHPGLPVVLLVHDRPGLLGRLEGVDQSGVDEVFVWSGDTRLLLSAIKSIEDRLNVDHDVRRGNVRVIIVVEDSPRDFSTLLPLLYTEIVSQTQERLTQGYNQMHRLLRMRARPKILKASTYEEGLWIFQRYRDNVLGIISDVRFSRGGETDPRAGLALMERIRAEAPTLPILFYSAEAGIEEQVRGVGVSFIDKRSQFFVQDLRTFISKNFGFGDFIFRRKDGVEVGIAGGLNDFMDVVRKVPLDSLVYHGSHNHFSNWFMAHGEFELADRVRSVQPGDFDTPEHMRDFLIATVSWAQRSRHKGGIADFSHWKTDPECVFARLGHGSIGGKARSIAFMNTLLARTGFEHRYSGITVSVPRTVAIATDVFEQFMNDNHLDDFIAGGPSDREIDRRFSESLLPSSLLLDLAAVVERVESPLAVRSSSLMEDSWDIPLAGVYATFMLPNNHPDLAVRLDQLCQAVKLVFASTRHAASRARLERASVRIEREKMGIIIQDLVGMRHGSRFYPDFSGVAQSYNFYPFADMGSGDGIAHMALGLGRTVVGGAQVLHFCPRHPRVLPQLSSPDEAARTTQRRFFALDLDRNRLLLDGNEEQTLLRLPLDVAESDGVLGHIASVISAEDEVLRAGLDGDGARIVSFEDVLRWGTYPVPQVLDEFLEIASQGLGSAVEVEFAAIFPRRPDQTLRFYLLQVRPFNVGLEQLDHPDEGVDPSRFLCESLQTLGHGTIANIRDVVYVRPDRFLTLNTPKIAAEVGEVNRRLSREGRPYILIGPGRWGSRDPSLGIPVTWEQIAGAATIVEADVLRDFSVESSQGSHFFHNIAASRVGYLTVGKRPARGHVDWAWLDARPLGEDGSETPHLRHLCLADPLEVRIDGRSRHGWIVRPEGV